MIPDDIKFRHAVAYHIMWKLAFIKWMNGNMPSGVYIVKMHAGNTVQSQKIVLMK